MNDLKEMRSCLLLWFTQLVSGLGSAMTAYALVDQVFGPIVCLIFRADQHIRKLEE